MGLKIKIQCSILNAALEYGMSETYENSTLMFSY